MDSVTQFVLGASIGEATLKTAGNSESEKPFGWGAVLIGGLVGTIPDLDVLSGPFLNGPQNLASHRGLSHSLFFCTLLSPVLALLFRRFFADRGVSMKSWLLFVWLGLNTHWMLDCLTTYGTQIFQPFSNYPVNIGSVFIVDPIYTLTLVAGIVISIWRGRISSAVSPLGVRMGLVLSTTYLLFTLCSKYYVLDRFETSWAQRGIEHQQLITVATPFNSILWYGYVDTGTDVWVADSSLLDNDSREIVWQRVPKNKELLPKFSESEAGKVLLWFSRGFYRLELQDGEPIFTDLRLGRLRGWLTPQNPSGSDYIFRFKLLPAQKDGGFSDFSRPPGGGGFSEYPWDIWWARIRGQDLSKL